METVNDRVPYMAPLVTSKSAGDVRTPWTVLKNTPEKNSRQQQGTHSSPVRKGSCESQRCSPGCVSFPVTQTDLIKTMVERYSYCPFQKHSQKRWNAAAVEMPVGTSHKSNPIAQNKSQSSVKHSPSWWIFNRKFYFNKYFALQVTTTISGR